MTELAAHIRIADLADPVLTAEQVEIRALAERFPVTFDAEAILDAAVVRTGLDDFGPMDFLDRLHLLCDAVDLDTGLHATGRAGIHADLVRYAANRLRIEDLLRRHPEIDDEVIDRPIVIAGLPRSGTTHLLNLLAADTRFRSLPYWESCEPVPDPTEDARVAGEDPRYTRCRRNWEQTDALLPLLKSMHAMTPDHRHEELELMCPDFASYNFEWLFDAPSWRDHHLATDQTPHYRYMRRVLKILQWQDGQRGEPRRRWVLKCPQHMEQLPVLVDTFPDATVVLPHRDPTSVIASAATMTSYGDRFRRQRPDPPATARYWADRLEVLLGRCTRERAAVPAAQSIDVRFHEFMADDLATVRRIHELAGVPRCDEADSRLASYLAENPRGKHGRIVSDLAADFGLDRSAVRDRFREYMAYFAVEPEGDR